MKRKMFNFKKDKTIFDEEVEKWAKELSTKEANDEWIWVDGYKGTDRDMRCKNYQFTMLDAHYMADNVEIELCESGFHFCQKLRDVFRYYNIGGGNRFFRVRALVRKSDVDAALKRSKDPFVAMCLFDNGDKLVSKAIKFLCELTPGEILTAYYDKDGIVSKMSDDIKKIAIEKGVREAEKIVRISELTELGFCETFAALILKENKETLAIAVGSQKDLSMDQKCALIFGLIK